MSAPFKSDPDVRSSGDPLAHVIATSEKRKNPGTVKKSTPNDMGNCGAASSESKGVEETVKYRPKRR